MPAVNKVHTSNIYYHSLTHSQNTDFNSRVTDVVSIVAIRESGLTIIKLEPEQMNLRNSFACVTVY